MPCHQISLGTMRLEKGREPLPLRALQVAAKTVMDVHVMTLTLKRA